MKSAALIVVLTNLLLQTGPPLHAPKITQEMITQYLAQHSDCPATDAIRIDDMESFNFTGHEYDDVIVVASTCASGTGGPDIHAVFSWIEEGELGELDFEDVDPKLYNVLLGNRNYILRPNKDRELSEIFYDSSGRDRPLTLMFQWDGNQHRFLLNAVQSAPTYKTSYDCTKAVAEVERAICYDESLARLDRDLSAVYLAASTKLPPAARKALVEEQREWLAKRNHDCVIYKGWTGCLTEKYTARIAELKKLYGPPAGHLEALH
jgi:uncharacterized protein YecT (DUF1311 family)